MSAYAIVEDIKDATVDTLAPEYHRLNRTSERQHLPSIEVFLTAVAASFLVPYVKRIAEKAADETWNKAVQVFGKNRSYEELQAELPPNAGEVVARSDFRQHREALADGDVSLDLFLAQHGIRQEIRLRVVSEVRAVLEQHRPNA
jgi:hypothetical protein